MGDEMLSALNATPSNDNVISTESAALPASEMPLQMPVDSKMLQEQLDQANQRIKRFEDWQQSVADHVTGKSPHDPGPWQEPTAEAIPDPMVEASQPYAPLHNDVMIEAYRHQHPELVPYEDYIALEVVTAIDRAMRNGRPISHRQAYDEGIRIFRERLQTHTAKVQQDTRQQARSQAVKQQALQLDAGGSQPKPKTGAEAIWAMSNEEFAKYKEEQLRKAYGL